MFILDFIIAPCPFCNARKHDVTAVGAIWYIACNKCSAITLFTNAKNMMDTLTAYNGNRPLEGDMKGLTETALPKQL